MTRPILYCGDTTLETAASYLAGILSHSRWTFDYVASHVPLTEETLGRDRKLVIFSDYPAMQVPLDLQQQIVAQSATGLGVLMIGGWESYCGLGGNWNGTPVGNLLPVEISATDDRVNFDQPALLHPVDLSAGLWDLPWSNRPPTIGGANRFVAKREGTVRLQISAFQPRWDVSDGRIQWGEPAQVLPALVTSERGAGRIAAFASDVAPHWVGGFVDWGPARVTAQAPGAGAIEVGSDYVGFWQRLIAWTGRLD